MPVAAGDVAVDAHDVGQVVAPHRAHVGVVAREPLEVVARAPAVIDLERRSGAVGQRDRIVALGRVFAAVHRAVDDVIRRQSEAHRIEPAHHPVIVPRRLRCAGRGCRGGAPTRERIEHLLADAMPPRVVAHADDLEPQPGLGAAELALQDAGENISGEARVVGGGELRMELRLVQRGAQPPLEIVAARTAFDRRIDRDHGFEIFARERPYAGGVIGNSFHRHRSSWFTADHPAAWAKTSVRSVSSSRTWSSAGSNAFVSLSI